eukprot:UN26452
MTIADLKIAIHNLYNLDRNEQKILYKGNALPNSMYLPQALRETPNALRLIPFPKSDTDIVIKDVDDEINLIRTTALDDVFDELENSPVPAVQQSLIDMVRRTMNEFDRDFIRFQDRPAPGPRFPESWEVNICDFRKALQGLEQLGAAHSEQLLNA